MHVFLRYRLAVCLTKQTTYKHYDRIINFLNLNGRLICFDYVQYYLTRQGPEIAKTLEDYSKTV